MSFVSLLFFACLGMAGTLFYCVPSKWRVVYLLALSYGFYATWSPTYLLLLVVASGIIYVAGCQIAATTNEVRKRIYLFGGVGVLLALVVGFKLAGQIDGIIFPLGLSYYSFKLISYLIEVYWDEQVVETDVPTFFLYPAFFPQIVSGPIQRAPNFISELRRQALAPANHRRIESGFRLILGGLMLKLLIGDRLGVFIGIVDKAPGDYQWAIVFTTVCCYTLQLYADFAGYTNIAIGIGKIFGIDSPPNFAAPFAASNVQEMWRRWHMSLTSWLIDYLFMPLQMAFRNLGQVGVALAVTINMVAIGLWHGITANFLVFGLCHALFVIVTVLTAKLRKRVFGDNVVGTSILYAAGVVTTFGLMTFSQLFWRTRTMASAMLHFKLVFGLMQPGKLDWSDIRVDAAEPVFVCMALAFFFGAGAPGMRWLGGLINRFVPNWVQYGLCLLLISALSIEAGSGFIYGQF